VNTSSLPKTMFSKTLEYTRGFWEPCMLDQRKQGKGWKWSLIPRMFLRASSKSQTLLFFVSRIPTRHLYMCSFHPETAILREIKCYCTFAQVSRRLLFLRHSHQTLTLSSVRKSEARPARKRLAAKWTSQRCAPTQHRPAPQQQEAAGSGLVRQNDKETGSINLSDPYVSVWNLDCITTTTVGIDPS